MSDLRERIVKALEDSGWTMSAERAVLEVWPIIEAELQKRDREIHGQSRIAARWLVRALEAENALNEANLEILTWKARAEQNASEWEAANQLLEQTIEVLEGRIDAWTEAGNVATQLAKENGGDPFWLGMRAAYSGCTVEVKPLLDNLKAREK